MLGEANGLGAATLENFAGGVGNDVVEHADLVGDSDEVVVFFLPGFGEVKTTDFDVFDLVHAALAPKCVKVSLALFVDVAVEDIAGQR